jgi:GMP synthase-like glutamine amidotransferase
MKPVVVIVNDEMLPGAGWVGRVLDRRGIPWQTVRGHAGETAAIDISDVGGLVVTGGRQHSWDETEHPQLRDERLLFAAAAERDVPALGLCLGGQIMSRALGGEAMPGVEGEFGWVDIELLPAASADPIMGPALAAPPRVYQYHLDVFTLPPGAVALARTDASPVQAFRYGRSLGVQFHPECDLETFELWHSNFPDSFAHVGVDGEAAHAEARKRETADLFAVRLIDAWAAQLSG